MRSLHSQTATVDLAAGAEVLSHAVTTATALADLIVKIGDGTSNLDATAETTLTVAITIDGVPVKGSDPTETVEVGRTRLIIPVDTFGVAAGSTVAVTLTSDKAADTAVAVTATLRDGSPLQPETRGRQLDVDADGDTTAGTTAEIATSVADQSDIAALIAAWADGGRLDLIVDAILGDTAELQSDWVDGGRLDLLVDAIKAKTDLITTSTVTITSAVASDGSTVTVVQGDSYNNTDSRAITWTGDTADQWPDLTGAALEFTAMMKGAADITVVPTVVTATGTQVFRMELASTDTDVPTGRYRYDVQATLSSGRIITLVNGAFVVTRTYTDAP